MENTTAPFAARSDAFEIHGQDLRLEPRTAVSLALAIHELATNASKYGALMAPDGHVSVRWKTSGARLRLRWEERDGPPVTAPAHRGFGTRMIEYGLASELGGTVQMDYRPSGLVCEVDAPLPSDG